MTGSRKYIQVIKIPLSVLKSPQFSEITRRLGVSRESAAGRLLLYIEHQYGQNKGPKSVKKINRLFGSGWCETLASVQWGKIEERKFVFTPPEGVRYRPQYSEGGLTVSATHKRDSHGRFLPAKTQRRVPTVYRSDAEGNLTHKKDAGGRVFYAVSRHKTPFKNRGNILARINIEDSLFKDNRFYELITLMGDKKRAIGALVEAWSLAQSYVSDHNPTGIVPEDEWSKQKISKEIIECGLARKTDKGVEVAGAKEQFSWLRQRQAAAKRGGLARSRKSREQNEPKTNAGRVPDNADSCPLTLTLTQSLTPTLNLDLTQDSSNYIDRGNTKIDISENRKNKKTQLSEPERQLNKEIWSAYQSEYRNRYGVDPTRNAKINGQIFQLAKRLGQEAVDVVSFYLKHNDGFYISKCHPMDFCLRDAESLRTQWLRGKAITRNDVKRFEQNHERFNLRQAIERGEI